MALKNNLTRSSEETSLRDLVTKMGPAIQRALPKVITPERFTRIVITAISNNDRLQKCSPASFMGAMMNSAQLGLEPNTPLGQAYLIPYNSKFGMQCQFQIGYQGLIDVARRAGTTVQCHEVKANDEFSYSLGLHLDMVHKPALNNRGDTVAYYAIWKNGDMLGFEVMTKDEVMEFAKSKSKSFNDGPWQTDFDAMAKKTVLKKALKYAPKSVELENAMLADDTTKEVNQSDASSNAFDINLVQPKHDDVQDAEIVKETGEVIDKKPESAPKESDSLI